jgi:hypothetical protein
MGRAKTLVLKQSRFGATETEFPHMAQYLEDIALVANIAGVPVNVKFVDLPPESQCFVAEYGLRQYVQDGAAVSKVHTDKDRKGVAKTDDEIAAEKQDGVTERLENLKTGEFTRRGPSAPKMTPEERERDAIVMQRLEARAKTLGKKLPAKTGKNADPELLAKLKAAMYESKKAEIDKEVARRLKDAAKAEVEDLTDLDALLG